MVRIPHRVPEHLQEGGGEEGVREVEGVAAGAAQPVRLLQHPRDLALVFGALQFNLFEL